MHLFPPLINYFSVPRFYSKDVVQATDLFIPPHWPVNLSESSYRVITPRQRLPPALVESSQEVLVREAECRDKRRDGQKLCQARHGFFRWLQHNCPTI